MRILILIKQKKMTPKGLMAVKHAFDDSLNPPKLLIKEDILNFLKKDKNVWENFQKLPEFYKRIRISFIENSRDQPELFKRRLEYFFKMTAKNKRYGMMQ